MTATSGVCAGDACAKDGAAASEKPDNRRNALPARLFIATSLLTLTGCPSSTYPTCKDDDACYAKAEVCVQGQCKKCGTDANCKEGFVCATNVCSPKPECGPGTTPCGGCRAEGATLA